MRFLSIFLVSISLLFFDLVKSDLYFGSNGGECYEIGDKIKQIEDLDGRSKNNKTEEFRGYSAFNTQQCQSRSKDNYKCCFVSIQYDHYWFNFCGMVDKDNYKNIPSYINDLKIDKGFECSEKKFKIDCGANYNKLFSFGFLLILVLIL